MRKEFLVTRQGKQFVLYAGLLDLAHENGLKSIITTLVQAPTEANNRVAICAATACMDDDRVFTGIGDAAPNNVAPAMQTCLLRMAETRAKSRALRDAVNIGVAAMEELGPDNSGSDEDNKYVETERPLRSDEAGVQSAVIKEAQNRFVKRARGMGYEGKLTPLCRAILKKDNIVASDYLEALKCSEAEWNKAADAIGKEATT